MHAWALFWSLVVAAGFVSFAVVAIVVAILGFHDVWRMLRKIEREHAEYSHTKTP